MTTLWYLVAAFVVVYVASLFVDRAIAKSVAKLVHFLRVMRAASTMVPKRDRVPEGHHALRDHAEHYAKTSRELEARGFRILGDLLEYQVDGKEAGVTRWFADADGTTSGWFAVVVMPEMTAHVAMFLTELSPPWFVVTSWGGSPHVLAVPPSVERVMFAEKDALDTALAAHRKAVAARPLARPRVVTTLEDAVRVIESLRAHCIEWRAGFTPDVLLDMDLRSTLLDKYKQLEERMKKAMPDYV